MFDRAATHNPHRTLWQTVLLGAVEDALLSPSQELSRQTRLRACKAARAYLTTPSRDLEHVCTLAGFEMAAVIESMRAKIAQAPTADALTSKRRLMARSLFEKRVPKPKPIPPADRPYTINGTTRTAAEWCERFDVPLALALSRLSRNWIPERAFTITKEQARWEAMETARQSHNRTASPTPARKLRAPSASTPRYLHNGESLTLAQWANRVGLKKATLAKRLRIGMTLAQALTPGNPHASTIKCPSSSAAIAFCEVDDSCSPRHDDTEDAQNSANRDTADRDSCAHKGQAHVANEYAHGECTYGSCPHAELEHQGQPAEGAPQPCANPTHTSTCCGDHLIHLSNTPKLHSFISNTRSRGVIANFLLPDRTGGVRSAHDFPDLSFSLVTSETPENDRHC